MPDNRYRVPEGELYASVQVPVEEQVPLKPEPVLAPVDRLGDPTPWLDGGSGDADGD